MNLGEIRTRVYDTLEQEVGASSLRWPSAMIDEFVNDGYRDMAVRSNCLMETVTMTPRTEELFYNLPTDLVRVLRLYRTDTDEKVWPIDLGELDLARPSWRSTSGVRWEWYFLHGLDQIVVGPFFTSITTESYKLTYTQDPGVSSLAADTDTPLVPRKWHENIVDYAVGRALMIDATQANLQAATRFFGDFQVGVKKLSRQVLEHMDRRHIMRPEDISRADIGIITPSGTFNAQ